MARRLLALVLICLSTSAGAEPNAAWASDKRLAITVSAAERNQVLYEMREFLHGMHNIHHALARRDMKAVAVAARPLGPLLERMPPTMKERLPEEFAQLGIALREAFEALARDAETRADPAVALEQMAEIIAYCSGCHDTYRFQLAPSRARR